MLLKETLREVARQQRKEAESCDAGIEREGLEDCLPTPKFALVLSGIRRCGKSTLLCQLGKRTPTSYFFNYEDPRVSGFEATDFQKLDEVFSEEFGRSDCYFFDEIQNVPKWELFVRKLVDQNKKVVITGSNASLLSRELGTRLTGRHLEREVYPFSFTEYLRFFKKKPSSAEFEEYMRLGGFPEYLKSNRTEALTNLLGDIIARDILARHRLRDSVVLRELATYLLSNVGKETTFNRIKKIFELGSTNTAISLAKHLEDAYVVAFVQKFDYSLKKRRANPRKVYAMDNGLARANSISFSKDEGRLLENAVFVELKRRNCEVYYFREKQECDFLVRRNEKITSAIQVCALVSEDNKEREIAGIVEAMSAFGLKRGLVITLNQEDELSFGNKKITLIPAWKWMANPKVIRTRNKTNPSGKALL